jgi:hypothetical protein
MKKSVAIVLLAVFFFGLVGIANAIPIENEITSIPESVITLLMGTGLIGIAYVTRKMDRN